MLNFTAMRLPAVFSLSIAIPGEKGRAIVRAFEAGNDKDGRTTLTVEVRLNGKVIFPQGVLICGLPLSGRASIDGKEAKSLVLSLVGMKPGDTDEEFFAHYSAEQLAFVSKFGDYFEMEARYRYGE